MLTCASCGQESSDAVRFCAGCGAALTTERAHEVRKTVTVLFADVAGSTALGEQLDPESLRRVMARYFETASLCLERHGGTVEKFIGDAVMAVFGVPTVHDDDALRAARAAVELRDALVALNVELEHDYGIALTLRTGVDSGEVVTGTGERLATGDAVNVAARLEQAARPGEILIGERTYALARGAIDAEAVEPLGLKGKAQPVVAYRLLDVGSAPAIERHLDTPLVGRGPELERLRAAFDAAIGEQRCRLVTILGPPGIGKSRMAHELAAILAGEASVLSGRCLPTARASHTGRSSRSSARPAPRTSSAPRCRREPRRRSSGRCANRSSGVRSNGRWHWPSMTSTGRSRCSSSCSSISSTGRATHRCSSCAWHDPSCWITVPAGPGRPRGTR